MKDINSSSINQQELVAAGGNSNIATFDFNSLPIRTILQDDGEIWFIASDVAKVLEYRNASDMVRNLDEDEADTHILRIRSENGVEQERRVTIINESGLYSATLKSRKPEAKQFKKWITSEVLPSIRKNGGYIGGQETDTPEVLLAKALQVANNILFRKEKELEQANAKVEVLQPKANALDTLANAEGTVTLDQAAKLLGVQPRKFLIPWLIDHGWIFRRSGGLEAHQDKNGKKYTIVVFRTFQGNSGEQHLRPQVRITSLGMAQLAIELDDWQKNFKGKAA